MIYDIYNLQQIMILITIANGIHQPTSRLGGPHCYSKSLRRKSRHGTSLATTLL